MTVYNLVSHTNTSVNALFAHADFVSPKEVHHRVQRVSRRGVHLGRPCPPMHFPPCYIHYHSLRATALLHINASWLELCSCLRW